MARLEELFPYAVLMSRLNREWERLGKEVSITYSETRLWFKFFEQGSNKVELALPEGEQLRYLTLGEVRDEIQVRGEDPFSLEVITGLILWFYGMSEGVGVERWAFQHNYNAVCKEAHAVGGFA